MNNSGPGMTIGVQQLGPYINVSESKVGAAIVVDHGIAALHLFRYRPTSNAWLGSYNIESKIRELLSALFCQKFEVLEDPLWGFTVIGVIVTFIQQEGPGLVFED